MTFDATSIGVPASMAAPASQAVVGDTFDIPVHASFMLWGLMPSKKANLAHVLEGQLAGGRAVQDLRIRVTRRWSDILVTVLTAGLYDPVTVHFHGVITGSSP